MQKITIRQLRKNGEVIASAEGQTSVIYQTDAYNEGDCLEFLLEGCQYIWIKISDSVAESIVYIPEGKFVFPIPVGEALRGFKPGMFEGAQIVEARAASEEDLKTYRNLCLNPYDYRVQSEVVDPDAPEWSNPTNSKAVEDGEIKAFPHAYANRVTRNEGCFYARNAIDGMSEPGGHGDYPYHSWGGAVHEDLTLAVYFGREVKADKLVLSLRSDYHVDGEGREHDTYWHTALIELSDGFKTEIHPQKSSEGQVFELGGHVTSWLKLSRLDPLQHDESLNFAALNQIELWGTEK